MILERIKELLMEQLNLDYDQLSADTRFDEVGAEDTAIGYMPHPEDIDLEGLDITADTLRELLKVDPELWRQEVAGIKEFYAQFGDKLPAKLREELDGLAARLK